LEAFPTIVGNTTNGHFPFTQSDRELAERTIKEMQVADVFSLYYTLWQLLYPPDPCARQGDVFIDGFTPRGGQPVTYLYKLLGAIYDLRTDLRRIRNPENGEIIDGLINPHNRPYVPNTQNCDNFGIIFSGVITVLTLGLAAPMWVSAVMNVVEAAEAIRLMRDARQQAAAYREFAQNVVLGYNAALALPETVLTDRATGIGSPGQPTSASSGGALGGAALLLLLLLL
jgi:hypothetical protein